MSEKPSVVMVDPNTSGEVNGVSVEDAMEVAEAVVQLFRLAVQRFGVGAAMSGLATAYVNMGVWSMDQDEMRAALQTSIDGLPRLYEKRDQRIAETVGDLETRKDLN